MLKEENGNNNNILALGFPLYAQTISHLLTPWKGKVTKKAPTLRHREKGLSRIETEAGQQIISPCSLSPGTEEQEHLFTRGEEACGKTDAPTVPLGELKTKGGEPTLGKTSNH